MPAQRTPDRLLISLHVSFGDDITTHEIPALDDGEKAALYYSKKDLKTFKIADKLRTQRTPRKTTKILKLMKTDAHKSMQESMQAMEIAKVEDFFIVAPVDQVKSSCTCSKTKDCDATTAVVILPETPESQSCHFAFAA
jgi:hypothetical protein